MGLFGRKGGDEDDREELRLEIEKLKNALKKIREENADLRLSLQSLIEQLAEREIALEKALMYIGYYKEAVKKIRQPPNDYAIYVRPHPGGNPDEADVLVREELKRVICVIPDLLPKDLKCGWEVLLGGKNNGSIVSTTKDYWKWGEEVIFEEKLRDDLALITDEFSNRKQCYLSPELKELPLKKGDLLLNCGGVLVKLLPKPQEKEHLLGGEAVGDLDFSKIGGLSRQIEEIKEALLPFEEPEVYVGKLKGQDAPRGILLDGPPGCGKTLLAKVIASNLAKQRGVKGIFIGLTSTELINKYVGETEHKLRELFARAQEKSGEDNLVVVFIDEIDALIRSRDAAMDKEPWKGDTVAQFCGLLDGIKPLGNVLIIGATNHKSLIDPAILRPGRMSVHINVPRPKRRGAEEILRIYLTANLPFSKKYLVDSYEYIDHFDSGQKETAPLNSDPEKIRDHFVEMVIKRIFYTGSPLKLALHDEFGEEDFAEVDNRVEIMNENGVLTTYLKDHVSGDMLANIVEKAKRSAHQRDKKHRELNPGTEPNPELTKKDFFLAVEAEYKRVVSSFKKPPREKKNKITGFRPNADFEED